MQRALVQTIPGDAPAVIAAAPVSVRRSHRVLDRSVFALLLGLMVVTAIPYGTVEPWWESLFECGIFTITALWLIEGWLEGSLRVKGWTLLAPMIGLVVLAYVQTSPILGSNAISADPFNTGGTALKLLALTLACALLMRFTSSRARLRTLMLVVVGTAAGSAIFGLLRQTAQGNAPDFLLPYLPPWAGYGQFINRNHFAFLMELGFGLAAGLILNGVSKRDRDGESEEERGDLMIGGGLSVPILMALALSNSRGGFFALLCQLFFLFLVLIWAPVNQTYRLQERTILHRVTHAAAAFALIIVIIGGVVWIGGDSLIGRLETTASEIKRADASSPEVVRPEGVLRVEVWRASWELGKAHWLTGVGLGGYRAAIPQYHRGTGELSLREAHNDYLELFAGGGIAGLGLLLWFLIAFVACARRRLLQSFDGFYRAARIGALTGLFAVAVHSLFDFGLHVTVNAYVVVALIAIVTLHDDVPDEELHVLSIR
jgi:O-antigen ligase